MNLRIVQLDDDPRASFPPVMQALADPDGLLAFGGGVAAYAGAFAAVTVAIMFLQS